MTIQIIGTFIVFFGLSIALEAILRPEKYCPQYGMCPLTGV